jgi:hypothetical protein
VTPERIAELWALCDAATPGPWTFECLDAGSDEDDASGGCWQVPEPLVTASSEGDYLNGRNAWFIAAARTALPEALDEIERLRADLRDAVSAREVEHEVMLVQAGRLQNLRADLDAMRTELIEAKRDRNAALDTARELEDEVDELNQRIGGLL